MSIESTKAPELTPAQIRAAMIAGKITKGLTKAQAEEVVDRQLARNAKIAAAPRKQSRAAASTDAIHPMITAALKAYDERLTELEERIEELEKPAKGK